MAEINLSTPISERNLDVLVSRMVVFASIISDGGNPVLEPITLHDNPQAQYPLSDFLESVKEIFLQLPASHRLRENYTISEVSRALATLSRYERIYRLFDPGYFLKVDAA